MSIYLPACMCNLPSCLSIYLPVCMCVYLSTSFAACLSRKLSLCLPTYLCAYLSIFPLVYFYLSASCLSACLPMASRLPSLPVCVFTGYLPPLLPRLQRTAAGRRGCRGADAPSRAARACRKGHARAATPRPTTAAARAPVQTGTCDLVSPTSRAAVSLWGRELDWGVGGGGWRVS